MRRAVGLSAGAVLLLALSACGSDEPEQPLSVSDAWVKASDGEMTGSFGVLSNTSDEEIVVVAADTSASDRTELHEVTMVDGEMVMQEIDEGFVVPAEGQHTLEPGADHIMIMQLTEPIEAGDDVGITLTLDDGSTYDYTAQAKATEGGEEPYHEGDGDMDSMNGTDDGGTE